MAPTVNWETSIITVPKTDLQVVQLTPTEIYDYNLNTMHLDLRTLEASEDGRVYPVTHDHNTEVDLAGLTYARVISIRAPYTITFEDGQYAVNLTSANSNVGDRVNVNQVSVRSQNSAGLVNLTDIQLQSFLGGRVFIDTDVRGLPGTLYPRGTPSKPVDNKDDAATIAGNNGYYKYALEGELLLDSGDDFEDTDWKGNTVIQSAITFDSCGVDNCVFEYLDLSGSLIGKCTIRDSLVHNLSGFYGRVKNSELSGTITISAAADSLTLFNNCTDAHQSGSIPVIDCNGVNQPILIHRQSGDLLITNNTASNRIDMGLEGCEVTIDSTCTAGTITIRGVGKVTDNSGAGCTVVNQTTLRQEIYIDQKNRTATATSGTGTDARVDQFTEGTTEQITVDVTYNDDNLATSETVQ